MPSQGSVLQSRCPVGMYELWQLLSFGGQSSFTSLLQAQRGNLGCFDTNFMRMGWSERAQSELTERIPDLVVRQLQRKMEGGHRREEGRKHQSPEVWKGRCPDLDCSKWHPGWKFGSLLMRRAFLPALSAAISQRMPEKQLFETPLHIYLLSMCWKHQAQGKKRGTDKSWCQHSSSHDTTSTGMR